MTLICCLGLATVGCSKSAPRPYTSPTQTTDGVNDNLIQGLDLLQRMDITHSPDTVNNIIYYLNLWIENRPSDPEWIADRLISRLPDKWRNAPQLQRISQRSFLTADVEYLREALWMRNISQWVLRDHNDRYLADYFRQAQLAKLQNESGGLEQVMQVLHEDLSASDADKLAKALRLFDWTVRNVQLEAFPSTAKQTSKDNKPDKASADDRLATRTSSDVFPPPGCQYRAWQTIYFGRGDAWQRARVFIQLARQQRIDVYMLAIAEDDSPRPWITAAAIGGRLFLMDTRLGLPLPGPQGRGIATLSQVATAPTLLGELYIKGEEEGEELSYSINENDLKNVIALVDAAPAVLSQRMKMLQSQLVGEKKMVLSIAPTQMSKSIIASPHIQETRLWTVPYETSQYLHQLIQRLNKLNQNVEQDRQIYQDYYIQQFFYFTPNPLTTGRQEYLKGELNNRIDQDSKQQTLGAKYWYMKSRTPDEMLEKIKSDREARRASGYAINLPNNPEDRKKALESMTALPLRIRLTAGYWLGLAQAEEGDQASAVNWFQRTLDEADSYWNDGANYNLARAYESLGQFEKAREIYLSDKSPQRHGNRLRARWLKRDNSAKSTDQ